MYKALFLFFSILMIHVGSSHARGPAVEDFVGVETKEHKTNAQNTKVMFDFGNAINSYKRVSETKKSSNSNWVGFTVVAAFLMLPFGIWLTLTRRTNDLATESQDIEETNQEEGKVEYLKDYQTNNNQEDEEKKKAS